MPTAIQHPAGFHCYRLADIEAELGEDEYAAFTRWFEGQTGAVGDGGELLVYKYDFVRWAQGQPDSALTWD